MSESRGVGQERAVVLDRPDQIRAYQLGVLIQGAKLEGKGLRMCRGPSALSRLKKYYGLRGNRENVVAQAEQMLEVARAAVIARNQEVGNG